MENPHPCPLPGYRERETAKHLAEEMIANFQEASRLTVLGAGLRQEDHPVWGGPGWKVFLDGTDDIWRTIPYVEQNPIKAGLGRQHYSFVTPYDNWPFRRPAK